MTYTVHHLNQNESYEWEQSACVCFDTYEQAVGYHLKHRKEAGISCVSSFDSDTGELYDVTPYLI